MTMAVDILSWLLLIAGSFFIMTGSIGLVRMPDFFSRTHPGGMVDTMGAGLTLAGLMLQGGLTLVTTKLALILVFLLLTGPTATHALAHAALVSGLKPWTRHSGEKTEPEDGS